MANTRVRLAKNPERPPSGDVTAGVSQGAGSGSGQAVVTGATGTGSTSTRAAFLTLTGRAAAVVFLAPLPFPLVWPLPFPLVWPLPLPLVARRVFTAVAVPARADAVRVVVRVAAVAGRRTGTRSPQLSRNRDLVSRSLPQWGQKAMV